MGDGFFFFPASSAQQREDAGVCRRLPGGREGTCGAAGHPNRPTSLPPGLILSQVPERGGGFLKGIWIAAALNFCVNGLLLLGTARMAGRRVSVLRLLVSSLLGAAYAAGCMTPDFRFLGGPHWRLISLAVMSFIAFGPQVKLGCVFAVLTMALGGAAMGRGKLWQLPAYAVGVYLLTRYAFGPPGRRLLPVTLSGNGKQLRLTALADTGNELRDPITGQSVLVIGCEAAGELTGLTRAQLRHPLETLTAAPLPGLRLIPYRAVGAEGGLLLAMSVPAVEVGSRRGPGVVAFAPQEFGEDYQAIAGGMI